MPIAVEGLLSTLTDTFRFSMVNPITAAYHFAFPPLTSGVESWAEQDIAYVDSISNRAVTARLAAVEQRSLSNSTDNNGVDTMWETLSDSPWSFVTSRYVIALIIVAILTNRIQHICRPRSRSVVLAQSKRIALRLPSLLLLARATLIFAVVAADYFLNESNWINRFLTLVTWQSWRDHWLAINPFDNWAGSYFGQNSHDAILRARDASAMWAAFLAACVAAVTECLIRNLEANPPEPGSFNLMGFGFSLHFHSYSNEWPANQHVYICVLLILVEILSLGLCKCRKKPFAPRLVVTGFYGILSIVHYLSIVASGKYPFMEAFSRAPELVLIGIILTTVLLHALTMWVTEGQIQVERLVFSQSNLPSLDDDWAIALFKLGIVCMESTRLTGLSREMPPISIAQAPYVELKQSGQIRFIAASQRRPKTGHHSNPHQSHQNGLGREVKEIRVESWEAARSATLLNLTAPKLVQAIRFFKQLVRTLWALSVVLLTKACVSVGLREPTVPQWIYRFLRLIRLAYHGTKGEERRQRRMAEQARNRIPGSNSLSSFSLPVPFSHAQQRTEAERTDNGRRFMSQTTEQYDRHQQGDDDDEEEDDGDWQYDSDDLKPEQEEQEELELDQLDADDMDGNVVEMTLGQSDQNGVDAEDYQALMQDLTLLNFDDPDNSRGSTLAIRSGTEPFNRLLLAHLTRSGNGPPLTRSGYQSLLEGRERSTTFVSEQHDDHYLADKQLAMTMLQRRMDVERRKQEAQSANSEADLRRLCVVCCCEERNVICWPCRCLCLCMECREHLASGPPNRTPTGRREREREREGAAHLCPTCRTPVEAFSRLYIP